MFAWVKRIIIREIIKRKGINLNLATRVGRNCLIYHGKKEETAPCIKDSIISGSISLACGNSIDGCKICGNIELGRYANINGPATVVTAIVGKISIGAFSSIGMGCTIVTHNHKYHCASTYRFNSRFGGVIIKRI